jgi:prevent-host-death family protein
MKMASVTELKNGLSACLREVEAGESILVTDRGRAVAVLRPLDFETMPERLAGLVSLGLVSPPRRRIDPKAVARLPLPDCCKSLSGAVIEEREGR